MKSMIIAAVALATVTTVSGCSQTERGAAVGALGGAAVGAAVTGDVEGAAVGGLIGGTAGALIGNASEPGKCYYRSRSGRRYIADC